MTDRDRSADADLAPAVEGSPDDLPARLTRLEHKLLEPCLGAARSIGDRVVPAWRRVTTREPRVPVTIAILVAIGLMAALPARIANRPRWLGHCCVSAKRTRIGDLVEADREAVFIRLRPGADPTSARRALEHIATTLNTPGDGLASVVPVQRPAEIVNYQSQQSTPLYLGLGLAAGATTALALTLLASVRRRRYDLAVLKTLGFSRRQLAATVSWQSTVAVTVGTLIGVPVGLVIGRSLWDLFAHEVHVVPQPAVPALTVSLVAIGALLLANIVAVIPARRAAETPTAILLLSE